MVEFIINLGLAECVSIFSALIALIALAFTYRQAQTVKKHNQVSVQPVLCDWLHSDADRLFFWIKNKGLGTANIISFSYFDGDEMISGEELSKRLCLLLQPYKFKQDNFLCHLTPDSYIAKDEQVVIFDYAFPNCINIGEIERLIAERFSLKIEYQCLYKNYFTYQSEWGKA